MNQLAAQFHADGFVTLPGALSSGAVAELNRAVESDLAVYPDEWLRLSESFVQTVDILPRTDAFDGTIENAKVLALLDLLFGEPFSFEEFSVMVRDPTERLSDVKGWHRDIVRDFDRRHEINAISVVYYLTDVTEDDHCFSIIPGTHGPRGWMRPEDVAPGMEVDQVAPAGSAILFHARCLHAGKLKPHSRQRRTLHVYYSPASGPRTSEWSRIPPRLSDKRDARLPPTLYAKWNRQDIIDGTGKKPRDLDPNLPSAVLLRTVQERANQGAR
jgi:hypothetical protein